MFKNSTMLALSCAALLLVGLQSAAAAAPGTVVCSGKFSGTARNLIVPAGPNCKLQGATITHDVIVEENGFLNAASTTIGHDLIATKPAVVGTGNVNDVPGPVSVGHDVIVTGGLTDQFGNHSCCIDFSDTEVGHDLRLMDLLVDFEIDVGLGPDPTVEGNTIGHDLVVSGNATGICCGFGPILVGGNSVGHNVRVTDNTTTGGDFGFISVFENQVGHNAICRGNSPAPTRNTPGQLDFLGRSVGPDQVKHKNSCG
jgi:hypothetical protein